MSRRIDSMIDEWARDFVYGIHRSGFSGINVVERLLKDPGISTRSPGHAVLWWPKTKRIAKMSRAMHQIDSISQICLIVNCNCVLNEDNTIFNEYDLARKSSLVVGDIRRRITCAKRELKQALRRDLKSA